LAFVIEVLPPNAVLVDQHAEPVTPVHGPLIVSEIRIEDGEMMRIRAAQHLLRFMQGQHSLWFQGGIDAWHDLTVNPLDHTISKTRVRTWVNFL